MKTQIAIKTIISILLVVCLFEMPYGYYEFVRLTSFIGFILLLINNHKSEKILLSSMSMLGVILFNPIFRIFFHRKVWNIIDIVVSTLLLIWLISDLIYFNKKKIELKSNQV